MANYFEQFDEQDEPAAKENYFAQFDEPEVTEPLAAEPVAEPVVTPEIVTEVPEPIQEKTPEQLAEDVPSPYKRPDGTPYPEARAYEPTIFDSVKDFFTGGEAHKARASNELTARKIAKEQGISVEEVYKSVGGAQPMLNPEGRAPIRALGEGLSIVGEQFASWDIPKGVANTVLRTIRGGDVDVDDENWIDQAIKDTDKPVDLDADPNYKPFKGLGKNLGYSLTTMTAGITAYVAGSMATTPVGGVIASGLASSAVAFRGSKDEYLSRAKEAMDAYYTQLHGRKMNQNEWDAVYDDYNTLANKYGAWEAIPEAIGNMVFIRAFAKPLRGASMGKIGAFKDKAVEIAGRTASVLATENITEIATAMGQNVAELEGGLTERELSLPEAIRETVIPTTLLTAIMGGAGGVIKTAYDKLPSKKPKFDQSDAAPELFTPTHKAGGGQDVQIVTRKGQVVPDTYIDAEGNVFRDSNAVATSPDSGDVSMDVNAVAGAIKAEIFGTEAPAPDEAAQPELEATLTDEAGEISDEYMHMRERSAQLWAEVLPGLSRGEYEALASETQGADPRAASESELQVIRERVQKKRALDTGVMRGLREQGIADASRGLQQATTGELAMPPVSPEIAREKRSDEAGIRPEKISERDDKTPLEAKQAEDLVTPEVLPTAEVQRKPFTAQAEIAKTEYQEKAKGLGLTEKQIKELEPQEALDVVTGLQKAENREPTMKRAIEHVSETGEQGHYIEADITNLGGLNDKLGHTGANKVYNKFATIFAEEMDNIGADATKFRHGGDEISAIVVNASKEQIDAALTKARDRIATYTKDEGLSEIVHPKHRRNKEMRGTGLIFGTSEITENKEAGDIFSEADISVEETKRERADVHRKQIETVGVTGVEGQARRTDEGARAEEARIAEQVAEKVAAKKPARLEPVSRRKEIEAQERQQAEQVAPQAEPGVVEPAEAATRIEAKPKLEPVSKKKEEAELSPTEKLLSKFYSPKEIAGFKQETSKLNESETLEFYEKKYDEGKQQAEEPKKLKPVSKKKSEPKVKVEPKVEIKPTVKTDVEALIDIWDQYYDTGELTHMDLVDEVEEFVADSEGNDDTAALQKAVSEYRKEQADDLELGGRGDMDSAEDNFNNVLLGVIEVKPVEPKPAVPATPAEPQDPYRAMYGEEISYEVELEDTGETYTVTVDAGVIMKELDAREEALRKLRDCI